MRHAPFIKTSLTNILIAPNISGASIHVESHFVRPLLHLQFCSYPLQSQGEFWFFSPFYDNVPEGGSKQLSGLNPVFSAALSCRKHSTQLCEGLTGAIEQRLTELRYFLIFFLET
jgi:hypothetical protein